MTTASDKRLREGLIAALNHNEIERKLAGQILDRWDEIAPPWCERCAEAAMAETKFGWLCREHIAEEIEKERAVK